MDTITAIEEQKRRGNRRSIFVNGTFFAGVDEEVALKLGLKVGQQVDSEKLAEILRTEEMRRARESALTLLDYKERTRKELERRLLQKGYPEDVVALVIEKLENIGLVNDERFASDWVASRVERRPTGKSRMAWDLRLKGIAPEIVEEAIDQVDEEKELEMALELARKKVGGEGPQGPDERRKLIGFLQRRGFHWEIVSKVLDRLAPEE
jgi:regulatory protein